MTFFLRMYAYSSPNRNSEGSLQTQGRKDMTNLRRVEGPSQVFVVSLVMPFP
jgi:hypothetical protein